MKKLLIALIIFVLFYLPSTAFALELLWVDKYGNRHYDCGGLVVGGTAAIKDRGRGLYRVKGVLIDRTVRANSILHAAAIACGEAKEFEPVESPTQSQNKTQQ